VWRALCVRTRSDLTIVVGNFPTLCFILMNFYFNKSATRKLLIRHFRWCAKILREIEIESCFTTEKGARRGDDIILANLAHNS
jgi:hypothetical protein